MIDFTFKTYKELIKIFLENNYRYITFKEYIQKKRLLSNTIDPPQQFKVANQHSSFIILRHDVDRLPYNALHIAQIENNYEIQGTYYFRIDGESYDTRVMQKILDLGHEIGYHYEDVDLVYKGLKAKGQRLILSQDELIDRAYESFCKNLEEFRNIYPVKTICMHGSPLSPFDNKIIWKKYDYRKLGIIGEPYLDIDFNEVFYLTDTGRRWDGEEVSVRDKIKNKRSKNKALNLKFHSTYDIIKAAEQDRLPDRMMITVHPQRWHDAMIPWLKELVGQNIKNVVKKYYFIKKSN